LRGDEIDLNARIFAVADAFDAMVSTRVYRAGKPYAAAAEELERHAGRQFDPAVVTAFRRIAPSEWEELRLRSLKRQRPERVLTVVPVETYAPAQAPLSAGKLTSQSSAASRISRRRNEARALRRSHRHA
jgi:HD-GYP domain-containing protein (c-di-GMP phosphodiesterase class II)